METKVKVGKHYLQLSAAAHKAVRLTCTRHGVLHVDFMDKLRYDAGLLASYKEFYDSVLARDATVDPVVDA